MPNGRQTTAPIATLPAGPAPSETRISSVEHLLKQTARRMSQAELQSVLESSRINNELRKLPAVASLLPAKATLFNIAQLGNSWANLVSVLVSLAEVELRQHYHTFHPLPDPKESLCQAIQQIKKYEDPLAILIYDPAMTSEDRQAIWRVQFTNFISDYELRAIGNVTHLEWSDLNSAHKEELFEKFLEKLYMDRAFFGTLFDRAAGKQTVAQLDELVEAFFPSRRPSPISAADFSMPAVAWSASSCVSHVRAKSRSMSITTAKAIKDMLDLWHAEGLFVGASEDVVSQALAEQGANTTEARLIINHLKSNKIIE